jgi:two-component system, LytTR family, response regulator
MKVIIVDDEPDGIITLKKMLELHCPQVEVVATCSNAMIARQKIEELQPDLVFLDIQMPGKSGLDMLAEMREINFEIIFVTAHNDYTIQAFRYSAVDYLLKPVDEDLLIEAVNKANKKIQSNQVNSNFDVFLNNMQSLQTQKEMKLCIPSVKGFQVIELKDIIYCEAEGSYTIFHLQKGTQVVASRTLMEYEETLKATSFLRVHKSFLINLHHIKEYIRGEGGSVVLSNGAEIEVSRRKKDLFLRKMNEFYKF